MTAPLITVCISGGLALALLTLFHSEQVRRARYARGVRVLFDRSVEEAKTRFKNQYYRLTGRTLPQSFHYIFHRILTAILRRIQGLEKLIRSIAWRNKNRANRRQDAPTSSHFSGLIDHKRETRLSDEEKRQKCDQALNGG